MVESALLAMPAMAGNPMPAVLAPPYLRVADGLVEDEGQGRLNVWGHRVFGVVFHDGDCVLSLFLFFCWVWRV